MMVKDRAKREPLNSPELEPQEYAERLRSIVDHSVHGIITIDEQGTIHTFNPAAERLFGYSAEEAVGQNVTILMPEPHRSGHMGYLRSYLETGIAQIIGKGREVLARRKSGDLFPVDLAVSEYRVGNRRMFTGMATDITERKRAEDALRKERDLAQKYLDIAGVVLVAIDSGGAIRMINQKGCRMLGYREEELIGADWFDRVIPPEDRETVRGVFRRILTGETGLAEYHENPVATRSGEKRLVAFHNTILRDESGRIAGVLSSGEDITEAREAGEKIRSYQEHLRVLASELSLAEERERRDIATELHDHLGHTLAISKIKLGALKASLAVPEAVVPVDEIRGLIDEAIQYTRSLTYELASPILYELGIEAALESLAEMFQGQHGISTIFVSDGSPKPLKEDLNVILFRAVRELLANVVKHAKATSVRISIAREGNSAFLAVEDDGIGCAVPEIGFQVSRTGGFGLFNIQERLDVLGGRLEFRSEPGRGTRVTLVAPLNQS